MNAFADLVPATTTASAATGRVAIANRGEIPRMADFRLPGGGFDSAAFRAAMDAWRGGGAASAPAATAPTTPTSPAATTTPTNTLNPTAAAGFDTFAKSAGAQAMLKASADTINNLYAAKGALNSGAAMKALDEHSQMIMMNNYLMPYMSLLGNQQAVGAGAASSIAGVGSSFGNSAANINANLASGASGTMAGMGGAIQNGADASANAAIANAANNANIWSGVGSTIGNIASNYIRPQVTY